MVEARFQVHGELNGFLSPARRDTTFVHTVGATDTLKHVLESLGIPHTEIGRVAVNGTRADSGVTASGGDLIEVWPHNPPVSLPEMRFVVDGHLGRLAAYLRMLGFDCWYDRYADDVLLAWVSREEQRALLTRDVGLLKRKEVTYGCFVRSHKLHEQLREVSVRYGLTRHISPFTRCMSCNGALDRVPKAAVEDLLPPHTRETKEDFSRCRQCGRIYWKGSHHARMLGWIEQLTYPPG
jgi:uncharacterized protein with PIN domain